MTHAISKILICHISFSPLGNASRVQREAEAAISAGLAQNILSIGYDEPGLPERESPAPGIHILRLSRINFPRLPRLLARSLQWLFWTFAAARQASQSNAVLLQAHSLAAMPASVLAKRNLGVPLIYDAHELETERTGWTRPQKFVARKLEKFLIRRSDHVLVVGNLIAEWYLARYGSLKLSILRNLPAEPAGPVEKNDMLRKALNIAEKELIFLYVGVIDDGRGYKILIEAFRNLSTHMHLVFMGNGKATQKIIEISKATPNIHWHPPVPPAQVVVYAAGADVGISLIEDVSLSYRYCLPNKLNEYRLAKLPVIVSNLPEMALLVQEAAAGWIVEPEANALLTLLKTLTPEIVSKAQQIAAISAPPSWNTEQKIYLSILRELIPSASAV